MAIVTNYKENLNMSPSRQYQKDEPDFISGSWKFPQKQNNKCCQRWIGIIKVVMALAEVLAAFTLIILGGLKPNLLSYLTGIAFFFHLLWILAKGAKNQEVNNG